jgi:hypothetical protein
MKRIYDAAFANQTQQSHHVHLGKFWWIDEKGNTGTWTRKEAYDYVDAHPKTVYVAEGNDSVYVYAYYYKDNPSIQWVQTQADGKQRDNLLTLAKRHAQGLANR